MRTFFKMKEEYGMQNGGDNAGMKSGDMDGMQMKDENE